MAKANNQKVNNQKANDQMPDLGKSINVFNNNPNVKNPFLRNNSAKPPQ